MILVRHAEELTKVRSLFRDRKRTDCHIFFNATISFSKRKGCSRPLTRQWACPFWNSLMVEFQGMAASSSSSRRAHAGFWWHTSATFWSSLLSSEEARPLSLAIFCCLGSFQQTTSPLLGYLLLLPFLLQVRHKKQVNCRRRQREGGGGTGRGQDLEVSLGVGPLFLFSRSSFRPFFLFRAISSSSSELLSTRQL